MQNKFKILNFILFLQIRFIYGYFINFEETNKELIKKNLEDIEKSEDLFSYYEKKVSEKLPKIRYCLEELIKCHKFDKEENINFLNEKNLLFVNMKIIHEKLYDLKNNFYLITSAKLYGISSLLDFCDYKKYLNIFNEFFEKNHINIENYLLNSNIVNSKSEYKEYIEKIKLNEFNEIISNNFTESFSNWYLNDNIKKMILSTVINKIEILRKMNDLKNNSELHKCKNLNLNYKKIYYNIDSEKKLSNIKFNIENIEISLNDDIIEDFNKLVENTNILNKDIQSIDDLDRFNYIRSIKPDFVPFKAECINFLRSLDSFFLQLAKYNKSKVNYKGYSDLYYSDCSLLTFKQLFDFIVLNSKDNYKTNINFISDMFSSNKLTDEVLIENKIEEWLKEFYNLEYFGDSIAIIKLINSFCMENKKVFSEKNESKFQEYLSIELNDILENHYNILIVISKYLNCKDSKKKKEMETDILEKLAFFSFPNEENNKKIDFENLKKSNIKYFLDILHENFNLKYSSSHDLTKYEIIFLSTIFYKLKDITQYIYMKKNLIFAKLIEYENVPTYFKHVFDIMKY